MNLEIGKVYVMETTDPVEAIVRFSSCVATSYWQSRLTGLDTRKWRYVGDDERGPVFEWVDDPSVSVVIAPHESFRFVEVEQ